MEITRRIHVPKALKELVPHYDENRLFISFGAKLYSLATYTFILNGERRSIHVSNDYDKIKDWSGHLEEYFVTGNWDMNFYYRPAKWQSKSKPPYNELVLDDNTLIKVPAIITKNGTIQADQAIVLAERKKLKNDYSFLYFVGKPIKDYKLTRIRVNGNIVDKGENTFTLEEVDTINRKFFEWLDEQGLKFESL